MSAKNLSLLMREVGEALRLDNENNEKEAYRKYVGCVYTIASNLMLALKQQGGDVIVNADTVKQVKLAQQCIERVAELMVALGSFKAQPQLPKPVQVAQTTPPCSTQPYTTVSSPSRMVRSLDGQEAATAFQTSQSLNSISSVSTASANNTVDGKQSRFSAPVPALPPENNPHAIVARRSRVLTPMEKASKQNQSLMAAYKARMQRLNRADFSAYNYSLTIQRKMAENIAIAKAQEEELARKMQARNQRLEQEAAKRFSSPTGISEEEQEQRTIYKNILDYENEAHWLKQWRQKLALKPEDPVLICQLVQEVLRCSDHPITELLKEYQFKIYQRLFPLVQTKSQQLAQIQVPFPDYLWPAYDDVKDIVGDNFDPWESAELDEETARTEVSAELHAKSDSDCLTTETEFTTKYTDKKSVMKDPLGVTDCVAHREVSKVCPENADVKRNSALPSSEGSDSIESNKSLSGTESQNTAEPCDNKQAPPSYEISNSNSAPQHEAGIEISKAAETETISQNTAKGSGTPEEIPREKDRKSPEKSGGDTSWERKQAQHLMRQVSKRFSVEEDADLQEGGDDLDYLFDDDDEVLGAESERMYSSLGFTQLSPAEARASRGSAPLQGGSQTDTGETQAMARSVSYDFPPSRPGQENDAMFQSLPYSNCGQRALDSEEEKKIAKLSLEACDRHLVSICEDIHRYLEKLLVLMTIAYEPLDTPVGRDQCAVSLEEPFFKPLWKTLLQLVRLVNFRQEQVLACVMTKYFSATPGDLKVNKKLWLTEDTETSNPKREAKRPYERVIAELRRVGDHYTMLNKLGCVVKVCRLICECVDDYYCNSNQGREKKSPSIGADDLLPILCYVVVQSSMPQLASECHAMAEFIHEGYLMGEEGYCLTTLRTALSYVSSLYPKP